MNALGIIALLLAIPLSIIANILTPIVRNKYALSSNKRITKRIGVLQRELEEIKNRNFEVEIFKQFYLLFFIIITFVLGLSAYAIYAEHPPDAQMWKFSAYTGMCAVAVASNIGMQRAKKLMHVEKYQEYLEKSIAKLKAKQDKSLLP
jgi:hypothetical protein